MSDAAIKSVLQNFMYEGQALLKQIEESAKPPNNILTYVARESLTDMTAEAFGKIASEVAQSIGFPGAGPRHHAKKYVREQLKRNVEAQRKNIEVQLEGTYQGWLSRIKQFLSITSILHGRLEETGNSHKLLERIGKTEQFTKLSARVRRTIFFLPSLQHSRLISNNEISSYLKQQKMAKSGSAYDTLNGLETGIREFLQQKLQSASTNWWKEKIPEDIRKNAEERKMKEERITGKNLHPIHYVDFPDYAKIICRKDNWEQVFKPFFGDRDIIYTKLRELEPIRNAIAHQRSVGDQQLTKLRLYVEEIRSQMDLRLRNKEL